MFKYDFIILYEHRNRELENAILLAMMLEKRGYKVAIEFRWSARILFQRAKVIIAPYLYLNETVIDFAIQPFCHFKKIINMQYEQVFLKKNETALSNLPEGVAKNAVHISWGKNTTERYKNVGIKPNHIFEIGHISMDLNLPKYRNLFLGKKDISKRLNIPLEKKWFLFISSFAYVGLSKAEYKNWKKRSEGVDYLSKQSYKSQPIILDYFEKLAQNYPDIEIVYRPHPHEEACKRLVELEKKYNNFKIVVDYSVRQWIFVSDYISTWFSTSLADVLYAKKTCAIIRPIPFSEEYDYKMYRDQKIITNFSDLEKYIKCPNEHCSLNPKSVREYYCNDYKANTFEKLRDVCIQTHNSDEYKYDFSKALHASYLYLFMLYTYKLLLSLAKFVDYSKFIPEKYGHVVHFSHREMKGVGREIKFYRAQFARVVENEET